MNCSGSSIVLGITHAGTCFSSWLHTPNDATFRERNRLGWSGRCGEQDLAPVGNQTLLLAERDAPVPASLKKTKLHGLSPRTNYTDRATAACRRSDCQLVRIEGCHVVSVTDPYGRILSVF
jgi:hypothetical protein